MLNSRWRVYQAQFEPGHCHWVLPNRNLLLYLKIMMIHKQQISYFWKSILDFAV